MGLVRVQSRHFVGAVRPGQGEALAVVVCAVAVLVEEDREAFEGALIFVHGLVHVAVEPDRALDHVGSGPRRTVRDHLAGGRGLALAVVAHGQVDLVHAGLLIRVRGADPTARATVPEPPRIRHQGAVRIRRRRRVERHHERSLPKVHADRERGRRQFVGRQWRGRRRRRRRNRRFLVAAAGRERHHDGQQSGQWGERCSQPSGCRAVPVHRLPSPSLRLNRDNGYQVQPGLHDMPFSPFTRV